MRIFARPYTGSIHTPDYSAHGSGVYPTGTGTASGFFTVHSPAVVDRIELRMFNADQSELLFEAYIPVHFEFVESTTPSPVLSWIPATRISSATGQT